MPKINGLLDYHIAVGNNAVTNTSALANALEGLAVSGGSILVEGDGPFNEMVWPDASANQINVKGRGNVTLNGDWRVGSHTWLTGAGKGYKGGIGLSPDRWHINTPSVQGTPGIYFFGKTGGGMKRISLQANARDTPAVKVYGGSQIVFDDISIDTNNTGIGFEINTCFWVRMTRIGIVGGGVRGYAIHFSFNSDGGYTGLITIRDLTMFGWGMLLDGKMDGGATPSFANILIEDAILENPSSPFLDMDFTSSPTSGLNGLFLNRFGYADNNSSAPPMIRIRGPVGALKQVYNVELSNFTNNGAQLLDSDQDIPGLIINEAVNSFAFDGYGVGDFTNQRSYSLDAQGRSDRESLLSSSYFSPSAVPYAPVAVNIDPSGWLVSDGAGTIDPGKLDPTGLTMAAEIHPISDHVTVNFYNAARLVAIGDSFIFGCWMRAPNAQSPILSNRLILALSNLAGNFPGCDNNVNNHSPQQEVIPFAFTGTSWIPVSCAAKVTSFGGGLTSASIPVALQVRCPVGFDVQVCFPWLLHVLAGVMSDPDINKLKRSIKFLPPSAPAGSVALFDWQKMYWGSDVNAYRSAAETLRTDGHLIAAKSVRSTAVVFASLPASPLEGMMVPVKDSTTAVWGEAIAGGGLNHVLAYFNGQSWTVFAK